MTSSNPLAASLVCHPRTPSAAVRHIEARIGRAGDAALAVTFYLEGDLARLRIPAPRSPSPSPRMAERLWQHTCFEAFIRAYGEAAYYEFNFSPAREWAAYAFCGYREAAPLAQEELAPGITAHASADKVELDAIIRVDRLALIPPRAQLRLALAAVVEENSGALSYWALRHPPGKADFHHAESFALEIAPL